MLCQVSGAHQCSPYGDEINTVNPHPRNIQIQTSKVKPFPKRYNNTNVGNMKRKLKTMG